MFYYSTPNPTTETLNKHQYSEDTLRTAHVVTLYKHAAVVLVHDILYYVSSITK